MSNLSVGQVILDAQRVASRVKDLDALGSALLVEAEGNNRLVESLRQFQDDLESLNRISNNKSNAEIINRIQQQNAHSAELLKENRELKICLEDYEYAMDIIMQKYREHINSKVLDSKLNFCEVYNGKLWRIIRQQREKINEMAAVMQSAAGMDDGALNQELETMSRLRLENNTLRELLQISKESGSALIPINLKDHLLIDQSVQTELDEACDELSISINSMENANNNSVIQNDTNETIIEADTLLNHDTASIITTTTITSPLTIKNAGSLPSQANNNVPQVVDNQIKATPENAHNDCSKSIASTATTTTKTIDHTLVESPAT